MTTRHTMISDLNVRFRPIGMVDMENATIRVQIDYSYTPGVPARGPSYYSGGEPAEGAEVSVLDATLLDGDGLDPPRSVLLDWCQDFLDDDGYDKACEIAEDER